MALPNFSIEEHLMKHFFQYCRLFLIFVSWVMVKDQPVIFLGSVVASLLINILDKLVFLI